MLIVRYTLRKRPNGYDWVNHIRFSDRDQMRLWMARMNAERGDLFRVERVTEESDRVCETSPQPHVRRGMLQSPHRADGSTDAQILKMEY